MKESFSEEEIARGQVPYLEHYIITSAVNGNKHGNSIAVKMNWETYATGIYEVPYEAPKVSEIEFHNGYANVLLENEPISAPVSNNFEVRIDDAVVPSSVYGNEIDSVSFFLTYPKVTKGSHSIKVVLKNIEGSQSEYTGTIQE